MAQWIWENAAPQADEYAEFSASFTGTARLKISADSNYAAYVNGTLAAFGQYGDFPHYKIYDDIDLTPYCTEGKNTISILVWYYGIASSVYVVGQAGVWFEIERDGQILAESGADTPCRIAPHYVSHVGKIITGQMGLSFHYDASAPTDAPFHPAVLTGFEAPLTLRPIDSLMLESPRIGKRIGGDGQTHFLYDVGCEEVGFLSLKLTAEVTAPILIAYGEHIADGCVRRQIGGRDFSVTYTPHVGENEYLNPFRRLGGRYLEIFSEAPITIHEAAIVPTMYPLTELPFEAGSERRQQIYDISVRTLRLCMHEHYEDCPWREQALYAMDSRNQIIAGYKAFGETRFPRACLKLIAQDRREDNLLSITAPHGGNLTIPSFSLHYMTEMREYLDFTDDRDFIRECWAKLTSVYTVFAGRITNGLIPTFAGKQHWNFYEWSDGLAGHLGSPDSEKPDLLLNCLFLIATENMTHMAEVCGLTFEQPDTDTMKTAVRTAFFLPEDGVYSDTIDSRHVSQLGNALAILSGVSTGDEAAALCGKLAAATGDEDAMVNITLSMKCFLYDALLITDRAAWKDWVLVDIDRVYGKMLDAGATSFWETEKGDADFAMAGSLCHGWSAMPAYYLPKLLY